MSARVPERTLRIAVLIEVPLFRESVAQALARVEDFSVEAVDPHTALETLAALEPAIVLVDAGRVEVAALLRDLADAVADAKVVAVAMPESELRLFACAEAGVAGLVPWNASLDEVVSTLRAVARGELPCSPRVAAALLRRIAALAAGQRTVESPSSALTRRELEIAGLIDEGLSNKQIALRLQIEVPTVKNHVHSILDKLKVHRRSEAAAHLRADGLLPRNGPRTPARDRRAGAEELAAP